MNTIHRTRGVEVCRNFGPTPVKIVSAIALVEQLARKSPYITVHAHGPLGWCDYIGMVNSIGREDGSGNSFNVVMTIGQTPTILYVLFK
jgi:hypothetical protein